jgi:rubrerythrin
MDKKERLSALEVALNNEQNEREFYLQHARRTRNPVGRKMFEQIADDELEHYQRLKELHEKWAANKQWPETVPLEVNQTNIKDVLTQTIGGAGQEPESDKDDLQALQIAIDFEDKGYKLYARLAEGVESESEKQFFRLLSKIEREHFMSLKDVQEYLTDPSSYFIEKERHGMDGA